jgi:uncharacterized protein with GYD domain
MASYIGLVRYTAQGIANIKDSPSRLDGFKKLCEQHGAKVQSFFLTMGRYDLVVLMEAPDDATVAKIILKVSSTGNVSTETLRAFSEAEYRKIVADV